MRVRIARSAGLLLGLALACVPAAARAQQVRATMEADRSELSVGQRFVLRIEVSLEDIEAESIELPSLDAFDVLRRQVTRPMQFSFSFGNRRRTVRSTTRHVLVLTPQIPGRHTLEPVRVRAGGKTYRSEPLTLMVHASGGSASGPPARPGTGGPPASPGTGGARQTDADAGALQASPESVIDRVQVEPDAFLRTYVDKKSAFVGEQVTATIYLYMRGPFDPEILSEPTADGFWVHNLLPPGTQPQAHRQVVDGRVYRAYAIRRFAAFPLRSGDLTIGPMTVRLTGGGSLLDLLGGSTPSSFERASLPATLQVEPLPEAGRPDAEVVVGRFALETKLDRAEVATGDAATLTARIHGEGNTSHVELALPPLPGVRVLPPQVHDRISSPDDVVGGERVYEWLLIPERPGEHPIPKLGFWAFDPAETRYEQVSAPPLRLTAAGDPVARAASGSAPADTQAEDATRAEAHGDAEDSVRFGPIRTRSALTRGADPLIARPWYPYALALPPGVWLLGLAASAVRRRTRRREGARSADPVRQARQLLSEAEHIGDARRAHALTAQALKLILEARLGEPVGGLTRAQLESYLAARGCEVDLAAHVAEALEASERARFSPTAHAPGDVATCVQTARALASRLERFAPKEAA